ncbi:thiamine phosphate synthase [Sphingobium aquiterrae]|uniref:thiamine phosphate synthase n=1 Tax=Sphingobium aquiterrae TaxID=2038656 RepID=UPI0030188BD0
MTGFYCKYAAGRHGGARAIPRLWLLTDERIAQPTLLAAAACLPRGAGIILRHYSLPVAERRQLFDAMRVIARRHGLLLLLAGTATEAAAWRADGWHGRATRRHASAGRIPPIHSAPAHDARELNRARARGADMVLISPAFPTRSHPGAPTLGRIGFARLARQAQGMTVIALGGMNAGRAKQVRALSAHGWAAIDGLTG